MSDVIYLLAKFSNRRMSWLLDEKLVKGQKEENMITLEELRQRPIGVVETRCVEINGKQEEYYLVKHAEDVYSIGFSEDGTYCSHTFGESTMLIRLNDRKSSDSEAIEIYVTDPHLSPD